MLDNFRKTYDKFSRPFWVLALATFIDRIGGTLIFPFFALYITDKFNVGMTEAGWLLAVWSISGMLGTLIGGAIADKFGRRNMIIFGLVASAFSSVAMGLVNDLYLFYGLSVFVGLLSNIAGPARQAQIVDLVGEERRGEAFGIMRVAGNLAWIIGPTIGGLMATRSYLALFILDAITSLIVAVIYYKNIPETKPVSVEKEEQESDSFLDTVRGYLVVFKDKMFNSFLMIMVLMNIVYLQLYGALSVYLRDSHGLTPQSYGMLMSINASTVVLMQIWISSKTSKRPPFLMMALGSLVYAIGFPIFGIASTMAWFLVATLIIALGEMIIMPVSGAIAAKFAPEDMRGRYMAMFGWGWQFPSIVAPIIAGLIMDNLDPTILWTMSGGLAAFATLGFYLLHLKTKKRFEEVEATPLPQTQEA
ncbi:MAG: MFS transporter [Chloroflexi bacterium]|jgi:MFS family permease|nr:MFS transporter [Chloroflexota bacterium]MBT4002930.1 MFS transporter [Chloroflexota bacterium]MBT4304669.1 MFS transporter [Chloroflexota bacterium]MBT4534238.1 MFS transporter [Chloroflexota bacterium]MBT4681990.1 MFS transporter [Chloroflexota bacterium]